MPTPTTDDPSRQPTIRDVAAAAGVSKSLVSLVFAYPDRVGQERRHRVLVAARQLGFRPNQAARSLAATQSSLIGILVADLFNPVLVEILEAARAEFVRRGDLALATAVNLPGRDASTGLDDRSLNIFHDLRPRGLLIIGSILDLGRVSSLLPVGCPIAVAGAIAQGLAAARTVRGDDWQGVHLLVRHLVELGHRAIVHVGGRGGPVAALRARAYESAMAEAGLASEMRIVPCDYSEEAGRRAAARLLDQPARPTAVVAVNDLAAVGVLAALDSAGARMAVTGYDGTFLAGLRQIDLTTIDPGNAEIGRRAAALLSTSDGAEETLIAPTLVVRGSTGAPRAAH